MAEDTALADESCVLVVDDEEGIRDALTEVVEMGGCRAIAVSNGAEALAVLAKRRPCLIILDLMMPVMSGQEMIEVMRREPSLAGLRVIVSTSAPSLAPKGFPVVPKPVDIEVIWDWMRRSCRCNEKPI